MSDSHFQRNIKLVTDELEAQLSVFMKKGADYIDKELSGNNNILLRPIVKGFYNTFARPGMESGSKGNIRVLIAAATEIVKEPDTPREEIERKYFPRYLKNDQTAKFCKKKHKNYRKLVEITKAQFHAQLEPMVTTLLYDGDGVNNYDELMVRTFVTAEEAKRVLGLQILQMELGLEILESDPSVLDVPVGRNLIMRVIRRGLYDQKEELLGDVDEIFRQYQDKNTAGAGDAAGAGGAAGAGEDGTRQDDGTHGNG
ncbi:MAG: hypothetical protein ACTSUE_06270 [Promethearchaeota archaeon]